MSIEERLSVLTNAIEALTAAILKHTERAPATVALPIVQPEALLRATEQAAPAEPEAPPEATDETPKPRGRRPKTTPTSPTSETPVTRATFDDAVKVLIEMSKEDRLAVLETLKPGATRLRDLAGMSEDIWSRAIAVAQASGAEDGDDDVNT